MARLARRYNARTQDKVGTVIPVEISVFEDRSFTFILKTPPAAELLKKAAKVTKGSGQPAVRSKKGDLSYNFVADVTMAQIEEIAKIKLPDLNTNKLQSAMNTVMGTAKNMGSTRRAPAPPQPRPRRLPPARLAAPRPARAHSRRAAPLCPQSRWSTCRTRTSTGRSKPCPGQRAGVASACELYARVIASRLVEEPQRR